MVTSSLTGYRAERTFRAMGTDAQVLVVADEAADALADLAVRRVELLEQCWSRFRSSSELSRMNASAGRGPLAVSPDLFVLVERMIEAWSLSEGRFDASVLASMIALGYDADLAVVQARPSHPADVQLTAAPGMGGITLDPSASTVQLPAGVTLDPGALGKGLAADLIVDELVAAGARGALVNLGGDVAFAGASDMVGSDWWIAIDDERADNVLTTGSGTSPLDLWGFDSGPRIGIATSTTMRRRWADGRHHVIDPSTGTLADTDLVQVTVCADRAWRAEALATAALLRRAEDALSWLDDRDVSAVLCTADRTLRTAALATGLPDIDRVDTTLRGSNVG